MIDPIIINPEELAGLEWDLNCLQSQDCDSTLVPNKSLIYEGKYGKQSLRFIDFKQENKIEEEDDSDTITERSFMNIIESDDEYEQDTIYDTENETEEDRIINIDFYDNSRN